jgi:dipeptidyl-peptidase-4
VAGSQQVLNQYDGANFYWYQILAQKGYIVACVDNRGTGGRGSEFKKCTYLNLGKLEVHDQIEAAKYFGKLPFIDAARIGIQGWSYGGFMASNCLFQGADVFKAAYCCCSCDQLALL